MFRTLWFQLHWFFGITAGIVLALVGVTGGLLSFESEILRALNPGVMTVTPAGEPLAPSELLERVQQALPERRITAVTLFSAAEDAAQVVLASTDPANRRGETMYVDPYSGEVLGAPRGVAFFRATMRLHRWLMFDDLFANRDLGKHIVGASTVLLIVLCLTGVYLRWPRKVANWRAWLTFSLARRGRGFVWDMHAVLGTWALAFYLLASVTGLYWSYEWYRNSLHKISGVPRPAMPQQGPPAPAEGRAGAQGRSAKPALPPAEEIDAVWALFRETVDGFSRGSIRFPQSGAREMTLIYLDDPPQHERAMNRLTIDPPTGSVRGHERYADRPLMARLVGGILPLHSGSYFGVTGKVLMMVASVAMPLFTVTGWMLYLERRSRKKETRALISARGPERAEAAGGAEPVLIAHASQSGHAESLAWLSADTLRKQGERVTVKPLGEISPAHLPSCSRVLFVVSTFGDGEPPTSARPFVREMKKMDLSGVRYALLSLGDRQYEHYCRFGRDLHDWLQRCGAEPLFTPVEVDDGDPAALAQWRLFLAGLSSPAAAPDPAPLAAQVL